MEKKNNRKIFEYFTCENKEHWLREIQKSDWGAGQYLYSLLKENKLKALVGATTLVLMLADGDKLVSFCTLAPLDDVQPTSYTPWVGFVYTFPEYRGQHCAGRLLDCAESIAAIMERKYTYISTNHIGLYEKYGYTFLETAQDISGGETRIYRKALLDGGPETERRLKNGARYKSEIVRAARTGTDPTAYCGLSCDHCFLGQWCGGCRSDFNCCSYGTLYEKDVCPNAACCKENGLDGCYDCAEILTCEKGFYTKDNDGAAAAKAQALFIHKHGKEEFFKLQNVMHKARDFKKIQEILGQNTQEGLRILEGFMKTEADV